MDAKVKLYLSNGTTQVINAIGTLNELIEKFDDAIKKKLCENYEIYVAVHGSYQMVHEGISEFNM